MEGDFFRTAERIEAAQGPCGGAFGPLHHWIRERDDIGEPIMVRRYCPRWREPHAEDIAASLQ